MKEVFQTSFQETRVIDVDTTLQWNVTPQSNGSFFIELKCTECNLELCVEEDSRVEVFVLNHAKDSCSLNVNIELKNNAYCKMGLLDLEDAPLTWKHDTILKEEGAEFEILSAQLCAPNQLKKGVLEVKHEAPHTFGQIRNFAVLSDAGQYDMWANGNILKGCFEAQSHQATRVLTLGKGHKANVTPLLLIDENNVKASHALSIGQPDEDQLYYLQSRGLTVKQALGLLSVGYFMPVIQMVKDEALRVQLQEEMEGKVGLYGQQ